MYRTNDPRFRRRLNEIGQTLENANETAQSGLYIFGQTYIKPCLDSVSTCFTDCVDASCPSLNLSNRDRIRRQQRGRARSGGRAELSFDFYDDWDEDENDGLLGWNNDEFDRLIGSAGGYGTVAAANNNNDNNTVNAQPTARQRGMSYPKPRRRSTQEDDPTVIKGPGLFGRLFGGRTLRYKPSAAGLQEHPGARRERLAHAGHGEADALLDESEPSEAGGTWNRRRSTRARSGTGGSRETQDSFSSRGDIFPSDDEDDAVPLDDEFAMVLERRATNSGNASAPDTENSSDKTAPPARRKGQRPSTASRASSRRTFSSRSAASSHQPSRTSSHTALAHQLERDDEDVRLPAIPTMSELRQQEEVRVQVQHDASDDLREQDSAHSVAITQEHASTVVEPMPAVATTPPDEPSQLPTPLATDDEEDNEDAASPSNKGSSSTVKIPG